MHLLHMESPEDVEGDRVPRDRDRVVLLVIPGEVMRQSTITPSRAATLIIDQKAEDEDTLPAVHMPAYGGATTLEEAAGYAEAVELEDSLDNLAEAHQSIIDNIMQDETKSVAERATAVAAASKEFAELAELLGDKERDYARDENGRFAPTGASDVRMMVERLVKIPANVLIRGPRRQSPEIEKRKPRAIERIIPPTGNRRPPPTEYQREKTPKDPTRRHEHGYTGQPGAYGHQHEYDYSHAHKDFKDGEMISDTETQGAFAAFKDTTGAWRWAATWSNNFVDRDNEVFPDSAHKEYVAHVDRTQDYPELWLWHTPGSKCGKADMIAYDDGFCLATGTFDDDKADIAESLARAKELGVSHGYTYSPAEVRGGQYLRYRTFEISPLPGAKASNIGTAFAAMKEAPMLTKDKREWLVQTIGEERATAIEENHQRMRKELTDRGISYKEFVEALAEGEKGAPATAEKPAETKPEEKPAEVEDKKEETPVTVIESPGGFQSTDGGKTWVKPDAPATAAASGEGDADAGASKEAAPAEAAAPVDIVAAVKEALTPITEEIKSMRDEFTTKVDAIKSGRDEVIAQAWASKNWGREVKSATEADDNLLDQEATKAALKVLDTNNNDPAAPYINDLMAVIGAGTQ